jgi:hypothetical protein
MRRVARGLLPLVVVACGCGLLNPGDGIGKAEAERIAVGQVAGTVDRVVSSRVLPLGEAVGSNVHPGPPRDQIVWAIVLEGTFPPGSCGPVQADGQAPVCPPPQRTALVVIDYATGEFILTAMPADLP